MALPLIQQYKERMHPLKPHRVQINLINSRNRFNIVPAGRRSGKTEIVGKRRLIQRAVKGVPFPNPRYFAAAPTRQQAKDIYWKDLKLMTRPFWAQEPRETELTIFLKGDREIHVLGMDKPERAEGSYWDGGVMDEFGNMKEEAWSQHIRPTLSTPGRWPGWCDFIGVPEGRNHYYRLSKKAKLLQGWGVYHWISADILDPKEIEQVKQELDPQTYAQEYEASFINFGGMAYYNFLEKRHCRRIQYDPNSDLIFCFDFNVDPGVAVVVQERQVNGLLCSLIIGEVYIERNSNTIKVCQKLNEMYSRKHSGLVFIHGDATGGARGSAKVLGSDWDLVEKTLKIGFGNRLRNEVPRKNPFERSRVNAVNSRLYNSAGQVHVYIDPIAAPNTVIDFEGTQVVPGSGEIDKKKDKTLSHLTDSFGYYINRKWPTRKVQSGAAKLVGT